MKYPERIKIVADAPHKGQDSIAGWIGREFDVDFFDAETNEVEVKAPDGTYRINEREYEVVTPK